MKFLIVDDDPNKTNLIKSFLLDKGINEFDVFTAEHAAGARVLLANKTIDVLLIDVLLPARKYAMPSGENSVELLRQIVEDGTTPAPSYIIGMTASFDAIRDFNDEFRSLVTQIFLVASGHDEWKKALESLILLFNRIEKSKLSNDYDICILNALREPELKAVYDTWPVQLGEEHSFCKNIIYRTGSVTFSNNSFRIVCASLPHMGPVSSTHAATAILHEFRPKILIMTGICGGFADQVEIGDIVVAEKSWDWQAGKWADNGTENSTLVTAPDQRYASRELIAEAVKVENKLKDLYEKISEPKPRTVPKIVVGPMVTGSSVVSSIEIQKDFRNQHRKMAAIDMECYGLYYASDFYSGAPVHSICIKSVSDLADRHKDDDYQRYCSHISSLVALEMIKQYLN